MNGSTASERWITIIEVAMITLYVVVTLALIAGGEPPAWVAGDAAFIAFYLAGITVAGHLLLRRRWWLAGATVGLVVGCDIAATALLPFREEVLLAGLWLPLVVFAALTAFFFALDRLGIMKMKGGSNGPEPLGGTRREP